MAELDNPALWHLAHAAWDGIVARYDPVLDRFLEQLRLEPWGLGLLFAAHTFEPQPISAARLAVRGPYTADAVYRSRLAFMAERGYFREPEPGEYRLTRQGHESLNEIVRGLYAAMGRVDSMPGDALLRLCTLLDKLVQACLHTPPPPGIWAVNLSYSAMPPIELPLPFVEQALTCLSSYRDDAHLAAWQPSGLTAPALETLTLLWRGDVTGLDSLFERLAGRGHPLSEYLRALAELRRAGYVTGSDEALTVTTAGREFRERVEQETDRYFYAPWNTLEGVERKELADLLTQLRAGLQGGAA